MPRWTFSILVLTYMPALAWGDFYFFLPPSEPNGPVQLVWNDRAAVNKQSRIPDDIRLKSNSGQLPTHPGGPGWLAVTTAAGSTTSATIEHGVVLRGQRDPALVLFHPKLQADLRDQPDTPNTTLELTAVRRGHGMAFFAQFRGQPMANQDIIVHSPGQKRAKAVRTDSLGYTTSFDTPGLYSATTYQKIVATGEFQGRTYGEVRHYATLTVELKP